MRVPIAPSDRLLFFWNLFISVASCSLPWSSSLFDVHVGVIAVTRHSSLSIYVNGILATQIRTYAPHLSLVIHDPWGSMRLHRGTLTTTRRLTVRKSRLSGVCQTWMDSVGGCHLRQLIIMIVLNSLNFWRCPLILLWSSSSSRLHPASPLLALRVSLGILSPVNVAFFAPFALHFGWVLITECYWRSLGGTNKNPTNFCCPLSNASTSAAQQPLPINSQTWTLISVTLLGGWGDQQFHVNDKPTQARDSRRWSRITGKTRGSDPGRTQKGILRPFRTRTIRGINLWRSWMEMEVRRK